MTVLFSQRDIDPAGLPRPLVDRYGRHISYLRISVTDRCDFRCVYCMSEEMNFLPKRDLLTLEESRLFDQKVRAMMVPTQRPVALGDLGSSFGWRIDPITGRSALHTGLDFQADPGTAILAAAGGVVVGQEVHPEYGNVVEVDHGNELVTRYAHASRVFVKKGDLIKRGQKIAEVGRTGNATGPHLHFELKIDGIQRTPLPVLNDEEEIPAEVAAHNALLGTGTAH